jgi:hypothetical protein
VPLHVIAGVVAPLVDEVEAALFTSSWVIWAVKRQVENRNKKKGLI